MIKSVNNYPVSQLFDISASVVYAIPRYQREYTWGKREWENLFDDVRENDPGYFLGSIICINQSNDVLATQKLEVVDGQQRLTTLSLLFASMYAVLSKHKMELNEDQNVELINLKRKLILKTGSEEIRVSPQLQNNNYADYKAVLAETGIIDTYEFPSYAGNRKIVRAYRYFKECIMKMVEGKDDHLAVLMNFLDKVTKASLVKIEVESHADAYILFESLNNRGVPLTAIDLIKNKLLAKLESIEPGAIDRYFKQWNNLLDCLGDDYSIQERFFRQYYNAFKNDLKVIHQVPIATRSNLIQIYEELINHDARAFLDQIGVAGRQYAIILMRKQDELSAFLEKPLKDLERIQGSPSYLLVLYLLMRRDPLKLSNDQLAAIIRLLVCFFVRRNLTDTPPTRDLTRLFMTIIDKLAGTTGNEIVNVIQQQLIGVSASDEVFRSKLEGPIYDENSGVTRFILCAIEEQAMTRETEVDLWSVKGNQFVWTIEHVFPQGANIPNSWVDMIGNGSVEKAIELQERHVHRLGNLTISGFNTTLGNKSFQEKRDRTDRKGLFVGYRNHLHLNEDLATAESWGVKEIDARTAKLVDQAMLLFHLNEHSK